MVLCSLHRLTPLAQRFLCIEIQQKNFFVVLIQGMHISLPHPLFPVYRFFFPVALTSQTLVLGFMSPSSRVGHRPLKLYYDTV
jgi:hypothetical protein